MGRRKKVVRLDQPAPAQKRRKYKRRVLVAGEAMASPPPKSSGLSPKGTLLSAAHAYLQAAFEARCTSDPALVHAAITLTERYA